MKQEIFESGVIYHIFNRGNNQEDIFKEDKNYLYFLSLIKKYLNPLADIYAYCLLKNHFHIILRIKEDYLLPDKLKQKPYLAFSNLFNAYSKAINKAYNRKGSLFQEHLHRIKVNDNNYLIQLIAYVHLNPVKHHFTENFKTYIYSSYSAYMFPKSSLLDCKYILELFGDKTNFEYWHDLKKLYLENSIKDI